MTRKYWFPLTYAPKIPKVLSGECTQTIRAGRKYQIGDLIAFHGWEGKPYHSKWSFKTPYWKVSFVADILIHPALIYSNVKLTNHKGCEMQYAYRTIYCYFWHELDKIAKLDGIDPPTGKELGRVLLSMHKIPEEGLPAQIIRWRYE